MRIFKKNRTDRFLKFVFCFNEIETKYTSFFLIMFYMPKTFKKSTKSRFFSWIIKKLSWIFIMKFLISKSIIIKTIRTLFPAFLIIWCFVRSLFSRIILCFLSIFGIMRLLKCFIASICITFLASLSWFFRMYVFIKSLFLCFAICWCFVTVV